MTTLSPIAKLPRPELIDPPNAPTAFVNLTNTLDNLIIPQFNSAAARDAAVPAPVSGQHAWLKDSNVLTVYDTSSAGWLTYAAASGAVKALTGASQRQLSGGVQTLTTADVDVAGCSLPFTTTRPNAIVVVNFTGDFESTAASAGLGILKCFVDATEQLAQVNFNVTTSPSGTRMTGGNSAVAIVTTPGSHTTKLRTRYSGVGGGGIRLNGPHTSITAMVFE